MNGKIWCESKMNVRSRFIFEIEFIENIKTALGKYDLLQAGHYLKDMQY